LIEGAEYKNCSGTAKKFMNILGEFHIGQKISTSAFTTALVTLVKTNELAEQYVNAQQGFHVLADLLKNYCPGHRQGVNAGKVGANAGQVAYNTITVLWILSYHEFSMQGFADY